MSHKMYAVDIYIVESLTTQRFQHKNAVFSLIVIFHHFTTLARKNRSNAVIFNKKYGVNSLCNIDGAYHSILQKW